MTGNCAICGKDIEPTPWDRPATVAIPPLCYGCEYSWANPERGWPPASGDVTKVLRGAFRDRRKAAQIRALAYALEGEAHHQVYANAS